VALVEQPECALLQLRLHLCRKHCKLSSLPVAEVEPLPAIGDLRRATVCKGFAFLTARYVQCRSALAALPNNTFQRVAVQGPARPLGPAVGVAGWMA
jgi:hypothetical protein